MLYVKVRSRGGRGATHRDPKCRRLVASDLGSRLVHPDAARAAQRPACQLCSGVS